MIRICLLSFIFLLGSCLPQEYNRGNFEFNNEGDASASISDSEFIKLELFDEANQRIIRELSLNEPINLEKESNFNIFITISGIEALDIKGGNLDRVENRKTFFLIEDYQNWNPEEGNFQIIFTPYIEEGKLGEPEQASIVNISTSTAPTNGFAPNQSPTVRFSERELRLKEDENRRISLNIDDDGAISSVRMEPNLPFIRIINENGSYQVEVNPSQNLAGQFFITFIATDDQGAEGRAFLPIEIYREEVVQPAGQSNLSITKIELFNEDNNSLVREVENNEIIDINQIKNFNLRITAPNAGSVGLSGGGLNRVENQEPFFLAGDNIPWTPTLGRHRLIITPYSEDNKQGTTGIIKSIDLNIVNNRVNQRPTLQLSNQLIELNTNEEASINIAAQDLDGGSIQSIDYSPKVDFLTLSGTGIIRVLNIKPLPQNVGDYNFNITATDNEGAQTTQSLSISVKTVVVASSNSFSDFKRVIDQSCVKCHGAPSSPFGGLASFYNKDEQFWKSSRFIQPGEAQNSLIYQRLRREFTQAISPRGIVQNMPTQGSEGGFNSNSANIIESYINGLSSGDSIACSDIDTSPKETGVRRLTLDEIKNSLNDLLGGASGLAALELLPPEGRHEGFDNVAETQTFISKAFTESYLSAVEQIVDQTVDSSPQRFSDKSQIYNIARKAFSQELIGGIDGDMFYIINEIVNRVDNELGFNFIDASKAALRYIFMSPRFLFVNTHSLNNDGKLINLSDYELARKLSLVLWKSSPDDKLMAVAKEEDLSNRTILLREAKRMMEDARFSRSRILFTNQWLGLDRLNDIQPDPAIYGVSENNFNVLRDFMKTEVQEFVNHVKQNDLPLENLLNGKFTIVNSQLASHYDLSHPGGGFQRINLSPVDTRGGLSTLGGIIAMNSHNTRRSIIQSGVWFLKNMVCDEPREPSDDLQNEIMQAISSDAPHRELAMSRLESVSCAGCHALIDGIGIAYNNFDTTGRKTSRDEKGRSVASHGSVYTQSFNNTHEFLEVVREENRFKSCLANKFLIYSTGEKLEFRDSVNDRCKAEKIVDKISMNNNFTQLILETIASENFMKRKIPNGE